MRVPVSPVTGNRAVGAEGREPEIIRDGVPQQSADLLLTARLQRREIDRCLPRGYRIVYLLKDEYVTILRVVHGARDLAELVRREPWEISD